MLSIKYVTKLMKVISASNKQQSELSLSKFGELKPIIDEFQNRKTVDITNMVSLLDGMKELQESSLLLIFNDLKPKIQEYIEEEKAHQRQHAPQWNVFKILGIETKEAEFHTPFLYGLLNPYGSHGQGRLFLDSFLKVIAEKVPGFDKGGISNPNWYVGRDADHVDLRICNDRLRQGFYIENKIYTGVRSGQLSRHVRLWKDRYEDTNKDGGVFYLTIGGDEPSDAAFESEGDFTRQVIEQKIGKIRLLSYKRDIRSWLEAIVERVSPQRLKQSIIQYIEIINDLGGI
ncbi:MAG: PD-(D/E)XK nuclease family protein [Nitrospirae bacterium]|nr:PD-(D/E)XK nuclease family protein [Nitrospirota bacterium]